MAKILLQIGDEKILLPDNRGLNTLLNTLAKGISVRRDYDSYSYYGPNVYNVQKRDLEINVAVLSKRDIVRPLKQALKIARDAGPDADGADITKRDDL